MICFYSESISIQLTVRAGITAEVTLVYQPEARATGRLCAASCQTCAGAYDSWPGNTIELYAWYQIRTLRVKWCGGWVSSNNLSWNILTSQIYPLNRSSTHVDLGGGVVVAGVLLTIVGLLAAAAGKLSMRDAIRAIVQLALPLQLESDIKQTVDGV